MKSWIKWEDNRSTEEIIQDILSKRSEGREIILRDLNI